MECLRQAWHIRRFLILFLTPVIFSPIPVWIQSSEAYTAYVIAIMAVYWCTEAMPLAATSLIPLVLFPVFGVLPSTIVCAQYLKDLNILFVGGLLVAVAVEDTNLHKRIALRILLFMGATPKWLMFGFMLITAFLSMWMSNTVTTAMMVPIVQAVINEIKSKNDVEKMELEDLNNGNEEVTRSTFRKRSSRVESEWFTNMHKGLLICVPYAANIGGTATITGTAPNLVASNLALTDYGSEAGVNFLTWMLFATPSMFVCLFLAWLWLQYMFLGCSCRFWRCSCLHKQEHGRIDGVNEDSVKEVLRHQYNELGKMSFAEKAVLGHFVILVLLWITRDPIFVSGWSVWFKDKYVSDSTCAIFIAISLFMFPLEAPKWKCRNPADETSSKSDCGSILNWAVVHQKMAWNVIILLGGGFAMAEGCKESGLSKWIGIQLSGLDHIPPTILLFIITILIAFITEFTSNTSTANIFLPLMAELAIGIGVNPLYFILTAAIACSFAFMLPAATPPNAIAFSYGSLTVMDMMKAGAVLNVICIVVANINMNTLGRAMFHVHSFPDWVKSEAITMTTENITNISVV